MGPRHKAEDDGECVKTPSARRLQRAHQALEYASAIGAAGEFFNQVLRVWHEAQNTAVGRINPGNVVEGSVGISQATYSS